MLELFNTFEKRIIGILIVFLLIPLLTMPLFLNQDFNELMINYKSNEAYNHLASTNTFIENQFFNSIEGLLDFIESDPVIKKSNGDIRSYVDYPNISDEISTNEKEIVDLFSRIKAADNRVQFVFLALEDGSYVEYPNFVPKESYDPRTREWYIESKKSTKVIFTPPYETKVTKDVVVSSTKSIIMDNGLKGVIGISINLTQLTNEITNTNYKGYLIVTSGNNQIIATDFNSNWIMKELSQVGVKEFENINLDIAEGKFIEIDNKDYYMHMLTNPQNGYKFISLVSSEEIFGLYSQISLKLYAMALIIMIIFSSIILIFTRKYSLDINRLSNLAYGVLSPNYSYDNSLDTKLGDYDELSKLSKNFVIDAVMVRDILNYFDDEYKIDEKLIKTSSLYKLEKPKYYSDLIQKVNHKKNIEVTYDNIINKLNEGVFYYDFEDDSLEVNYKFNEDIFNGKGNEHYTINKLIDKIDEDFKEQFILIIKNLSLKPSTSSVIEIQINYNENKKWFQFRLMNIFDSNKKRNIIIGIIYDINSKKMIEGKIDQENLRLRELLDVNNTEILDLHNRIFDLNREISSFKEKLDFEIGQNTELRERLDLCVNELEKATTIVRNTQDTLINSEKVSTMGAMVANIAQEITSPLGISLTVSSFIEKMINDYKGNHIKDAIGEEQAKLLDESVVMLGTNIKKSIELISSFKNVIATQVEEERKPFNVNELINQVIINLNNKLKKVKVIVNCDEMVSFKSYQGHFTQIITSLIINSVEHAFESDSKDSTIRIDVLKIPSGIDISFKDNGKGIDKALNETIFEPFYTTRKKKGNLGLGLYIIRSLISKNFSGEIYLKENSEWSTEFKIILKEQKEKGTML